MAIRRPATITRRESPITWPERWYSCCVGMFGLEDEQRSHRCPRYSYIHSCSYPFLSATNLLLARFLAYIDQCSCNLTCTNGKTWLLHVVDSFRLVLVMEGHLCDSNTPPLYSLMACCSESRTMYFTCPCAFYSRPTCVKAIKPVFAEWRRWLSWTLWVLDAGASDFSGHLCHQHGRRRKSGTCGRGACACRRRGRTRQA